jgi:hypothetical protein
MYKQQQLTIEPSHPYRRQSSAFPRLASGASARHVRTFSAFLSALNTDAAPLPVRAGALCAEDVDVVCVGGSRTSNTAESEAGDGDAACGFAGG